MTGARSVALAGAVAVAAASGGCARWDADDAWDAGAVRAVARRVGAAEPGRPIIVLRTAGGPDGVELPWGVRQSLTTGGIPLGDTTALRDPAVRLLVFRQPGRDGELWTMETHMLEHDGVTRPVRWRVHCVTDAPCEVTDSAQVNGGTRRE